MTGWRSELNKIGSVEVPESLSWDRVQPGTSGVARRSSRRGVRLAAVGLGIFVFGALGGVAAGGLMHAPDGSSVPKVLVHDGQGWNQYVWDSDKGFACTQLAGDAPGSGEGFGCGMHDPVQPFWAVTRRSGVIAGILYPHTQISATVDGEAVAVESTNCPCGGYDVPSVVFSVELPKTLAEEHAAGGVVWVTLEVHESSHAPGGTPWATLQESVALDSVESGSNT
jgi:hypothetical protein